MLPGSVEPNDSRVCALADFINDCGMRWAAMRFISPMEYARIMYELV